MITIQGSLQYQQTKIHWEFYANDLALIVNGQGGLILSCQDDVLELEWNTLQCRELPWKINRPTKVEIDGSKATVYRTKDFESWQRIAQLLRENLPA